MSLKWILILALSCHPSLENDCDAFEDWSLCYGQVEHVSVVFRHGIRTPLEVYPTDPHSNPDIWPDGYGELTKEGVHQQYLLGMWLGDRYTTLLPPKRNYNRSVVRVVSSDVDRTIMSAAANMAGMFPLSSGRNWGGVDWYPVPIHTIAKEHDNFSSHCARYDAEYLKFNGSEDYGLIQERFQDVLNFAGLMSGWKMDVRHMTHLYDTLLIESLYSLPLPHWTQEIFPGKMVDLVGIEFAFATWTLPLKRLKCGVLLKTLLDNMKRKINGSLVENISVYSGHDTTISALLNSIGVFDFLPPPFAATVLFELRQTSGREPVVTIFYKNSPEIRSEPVPLCLPGCTFACPLSQLEILWTPLLVHDWEKECEV